MGSIGNKQTNEFKASNGSKCFTVVDTLDLGVALFYQTSLIVNGNPMSILLVLEYPLGSNNIMVLLWPWIYSKVILCKILLHFDFV